MSELLEKILSKDNMNTACTRSLLLLCCSAPSRKHPTCLARMQKNGRRDNSLCTEIKSSIEILSVNEKEMTLSGNHV